eukprot:TRINITY_DN23594_c0_g1_i1.p1 TRINITY_DN23594_c0_g1~~TRINITY_DN23594_c0_g1_i1.p1  ORF type:complete len:1072 (+),score=245.31 TRINITY_DN23594_c0_g1_i1:101-3217(+)
MEKKANSKPMNAILNRLLQSGHFTVVYFAQEVILNAPIEEWPHPVDFLISFYSDGFPLEKAEAYAALRKPHCINDLKAQRLLLDRRSVYGLLAQNGIPCPKSILIERDVAGNLLGPAAECFVEADDYIQVGDEKLQKPFVEKPVDAENHNIHIYYPSSAGGGRRCLFRKVDNKSADYDASVNTIRRDGTYMYEQFFQTGGTDIKVYTVGEGYAHAEARKSPVVDGLVNRDKNGKEVRTPVVLTTTEKEFAKVICKAFEQLVCGFDMLRTPDKTYVIDVNGWSFVKGVQKYYEDAAAVLGKHMLEIMGPLNYPIHSDGTTSNFLRVNSEADNLSRPPQSGSLGRWENQELLAVLAVMRHGDRTPKNKMKLITRRREFIALHEHWAKGPLKEAKLKAPKQLQEVLDLANSMLAGKPSTTQQPRNGGNAESDITEDESDVDHAGQPQLRSRAMSLDDNELESLLLIRSVLSKGERFDGIHRKVQLKPTSWNEAGQVEEVVIILKYGGTITPAGIAQAESLGRRFRSEMYPGEIVSDEATTNPAERGGLLRLHATQRHDFKVYSSDEGRVQMSATAFTRGLLDLDGGELTPICVALVETAPAMLDDLSGEAESLMKDAKANLNKRILGTVDDSGELTAPPLSVSTKDLEDLHRLVAAVCSEIEALDMSAVTPIGCGPERKEEPSSPDALTLCSTTKPNLVLKRWQKLRDDLRDSKRDTWNISKVPEICDAVKYDLIHSQGLAKGFLPLMDIAKKIGDVVVPLEYGDDLMTRAQIGKSVSGSLVRKLLIDMQKSAQEPVDSSDLQPWKVVTAAQYLARTVGRLFRGKGSDEEHEKEAVTHEEIPATPSATVTEADFAGLHPEHAGHFMNPDRRVRTRLYFTSESHIQAMMNVLRYCHLVKPLAKSASGASGYLQSSEGKDVAGSRPASPKMGHPGIVCAEAEEQLRQEPICDYLTQIVFRLYEDKLAPIGSEERYRVEVLFSPGANGHPSAARGHKHTMPLKELQPLHEVDQPLTLARLKEIMSPFASAPLPKLVQADATSRS